MVKRGVLKGVGLGLASVGVGHGVGFAYVKHVKKRLMAELRRKCEEECRGKEGEEFEKCVAECMVRGEKEVYRRLDALCRRVFGVLAVSEFAGGGLLYYLGCRSGSVESEDMYFTWALLMFLSGAIDGLMALLFR